MTAAPGLHLSGTARIGGTAVFGPLSLEAPAAQWTCLLGPSGAGKSTILRLFAGLAEGVALEGRAAASDGAPLAGRVALMAQDDLLMPWLSALDNVTLGTRLRGRPPDREKARTVLSRVGLDGHASKRPAALSGGQRQRVALARTLMEERPVVLLDEPFSALDARTRARMQELSADLLRGRTVLHVTHDPAEAARLGQRVLILTRAGLCAIEPPESAPPRPVDAPETLELQGALHRQLMAAP